MRTSKVMDNGETIRFINASIRYKPGWTIEAFHDPNRFGGVVVRVTAPIAIDSRTFEPTTPVGDTLAGGFSIFTSTQEEVTRQVMQAIMKLEAHEAREFFRVDGELIYDPHTIVGDERYGETT